jgi:quercetin dioxygenase-like cupin family protein
MDFVPIRTQDGTALVLADPSFPSVLTTWHRFVALPANATHFGFVTEGQAVLSWEHGSHPVPAGFYFAVPGGAELHGGRGFVATRTDWLGLFSIGGPIESKGRLKYIDGCTDTLLIGPPRCGDPCLNLLHLPPGTDQTMHTHPSWRAGVIASGTGTCVTDATSWPLSSGQAFAIPPNTRHCFQTRQEALRVVAWHPDTDVGPTDDDHPMVNRTVIP